MRHKKFRNRPAKSTLASVDQAVKDAYDRGEITQDVYEGLIRRGLEDMRGKEVPYWADAVVVEEVPAAPVDECLPEEVPASSVDDCLPEEVPAPSVDDCLPEEVPAPSVDGCLPEEAPPSPFMVSAASIRPSPELEQLQHGECSNDGSLASLSLPKDRLVAEEEATDVAAVKANQESLIPDGSAITHCFGCLRADVVEYADRTLPAYLRPHGESLLKPVVIILCGTCRKDPHFSGHSKILLDREVGASWSRLRLRPEMFSGSAAMKTIRSLVGGDISILTTNGGVLYREVDEIVRRLGPDDRMVSIDVAAFRRGQRENLKLPYLRGGLAAST